MTPTKLDLTGLKCPLPALKTRETSTPTAGLVVNALAVGVNALRDLRLHQQSSISAMSAPCRHRKAES